MTQRPFNRPPLRRRLLPDKYLAQGYFITDYVLYDRLIIDDPRKIVYTLTDTSRDFEDKAMEYGQFRKFYNFARQIERRLQWGETWEKARQDILRLTVHATYACNRQLAPRVFLEFMDLNVKIAADINKQEAFLKGFLIHIESIIAFWPSRKGSEE